jgi:hypothetical protein
MTAALVDMQYTDESWQPKITLLKSLVSRGDEYIGLDNLRSSFCADRWSATGAKTDGRTQPYPLTV